MKPSIAEVHFDELANAALQQLLKKKNYSTVFVLVDENTERHCLPLFLRKVAIAVDSVICIKAGEVHKNIDTCKAVWDALSLNGGDRNSLLINLGGGVITDLGGFVASTFKRGIDFVNVPTTLLAMVDAAIGGKTGVDFEALKNQIGIIRQSQLIAVFPEFLNTLDERQVWSGFAEMLKHGLIADAPYWKELKSTKSIHDIISSIQRSVEIKNEVVAEDVNENGLRKILNFGHTLGHAIESYFLMAPERETLLHGEAIAIGMILEAYLSHQLTGLSKVELDEISNGFIKHFQKTTFTKTDIENSVALLKHDKKNTHGSINFVLLKTIGHCAIDIKVPDHFIEEAFEYYNNL